MRSPDSLALILRAKGGDKAAWEELCGRYYPAWLKELHGRLGKDLRVLYATEDILQSAIADALRDIKGLRNEGAFFSWVSAISRRKVAEKRRRLGRSPGKATGEISEQAKENLSPEESLASQDDYIQVLDAMLVLFPDFPEQMGVLYFKYFEKLDVKGLQEVFNKRERRIYNLLRNAKDLLRSKLAEARE